MKETWLYRGLKRFLVDENYASQKVRAVIGMIGLATLSGIIKVPEVPDTPWGWYVTRAIGLLLAGCAWWVRAGDKTLRTLNETPDAELHAVGVATVTPPPAPPSQG